MRLLSGIAAFRSTISLWIAAAHSTASTTDGNSSSSPSPIVLTMPAPLRHEGSRRVPMLANDPRGSGLILPHEAGITDDVDGHDRGKLACFGHSAPQAALAQ